MTPDNIEDQVVESSTVAAADLLPGTLLDGKYEIIGLVAHGAMGRVYRAHHRAMQRDVAIKTMHLHLLRSGEALERFKREVVVSAGLTHPGIVKVYAAGIASGGEPFLAMDFLTGQPLQTILANESLKLPRFFELFAQVIEALKYAHAEGIVHRDLKPSNIFVIQDGATERTVLIDFGIAKAVAESADQKVTQTGALVGTSFYMSPEQCTTGLTDTRSDIYSLGCVMYEALVGKPPFQGESAFDVMYKHLHQSLSDLGALNKLPKALSEMILKCMQKSPDQRYQSAAELQKDFQRCAKQAKSLRYRIFVSRKLQIQTAVVAAMLAVGGSVAYHVSHPAALQEPQKHRLKPGDLEKPPRGLKALIEMVNAYRGELHSEIDANKLLISWLNHYKKDPNLALWERGEVKALLAESYRRLGDYQLSEQTLQQAMKDLSGPPLKAAGLQLAMLHRDQGRLDLTQKELQQILAETDPQDRLQEGIWTELYHLRLAQGDFKGADEVQQKLIKVMQSFGRIDPPAAAGIRRERIELMILSRRTEEARALLKEQLDQVKGLRPDQKIGELTAAASAFRKLGDFALQERVTREAVKNLNSLGRKSEADEFMVLIALCQDGNGDYDKAVKLLAELISGQMAEGRKHDALKTRLALARIHNRNYAFARAVDELKPVIQAYPDVPTRTFEEALSSCQACLLTLHREAEAERLLQEFKDKEDSDKYKAFWNSLLAVQRRALGDNLGALAAYKTSLDYRKRYAEVSSCLRQADIYCQMASIYNDMSDLQAALQSYKKGAELLRGRGGREVVVLQTQILARVAQLEALFGHTPEAEAYATELLQLNSPENPRERAAALVEVGRTYLFLGRFNEAKRWFQDAISVADKGQIMPQNDTALVARRSYAEALYRLGKKDEARKIVLEALREWQNPVYSRSIEKSSTYGLLSNWALEEGDYKQAIEYMRKLVQEYGQQPHLYMYEQLLATIFLGDLHRQSGDRRAAFETYRWVIDEADDSLRGRRLKARALRSYGNALKDEKRFEQARMNLSESVKEYDATDAFSEESLALCDLASVLEEMKLYQQASETWLRAAAVSKKVAGIRPETVKSYIERAQKLNLKVESSRTHAGLNPSQSD